MQVEDIQEEIREVPTYRTVEVPEVVYIERKVMLVSMLNSMPSEVIAVYLADADVKLVYDDLTVQGVQGVLVAQFEHAVGALVFKDRNKNVKLRGELRLV